MAQLAVWLAEASPEAIDVLEVEDWMGEADLAGMLHGLADTGTIHTILVSCPEMPPLYLRQLLHGAVEIPVSSSPHQLRVNVIAAIVDLEELMKAVLHAQSVCDVLEGCADDDRSVAEIIIEQVEYADLLLVRGTEKYELEDVEQFYVVLTFLNPEAAIETCLICAFDSASILHHHQAEPAFAWREPAWLGVIEGRRLLPERSHGVSSVTWRNRGALDPKRFYDLIHGGVSGLIRARGFFWLATRPSLIGSLNTAGSRATVEATGWWWAATPIEEWPADPVERDLIRSDWDPVTGDRNNELVFIGTNLDEELLLADLEACVISSSDWVFNGSGAREDPFAEWDDGTTNGIRLITEWGPPYPLKCN